MGDIDGSSNAAQRAQPLGQEDIVETDLDDASNADRPGFFRRVIDAFGPSDTDENEAGDAAETLRPVALGMINLRRLRVEDVAIPSADIIAVPDTITKDELVAVFRDSGLTRLPVYNGTLDTPVGMAHLKDFALMHGFNGSGEGRFSLKKMLRPLMFVPPSMSIGVLLTKMQAERRHMALVIDEYGGVDGLVTIEDLIEQVIGEIEDEHDTADGEYWVKEKPGCYVALAKTPLDEFEAEIGQSLTDHHMVDEEEIDTLGGLVYMLASRIPSRGEVVVHPDGPEFEVIDADPRRIKRLRVRLPGVTDA
jgi:magnesium and cobalt transporter